MKKIYIFLIALVAGVGCFLGALYFNKPTSSVDNFSENNNSNQQNSYKGDLTIVGFGPDVSFEPTVKSTTLVLHKVFEDHEDHLFIKQHISGYTGHLLPGDTVSFKGKVVAIDVGAGNRYYDVTSIDTLEKIGIPTQEKINQLLNTYAYCEKDSDCTSFYADCPFGCGRGINVKFLDVAQNIIQQFRSQQSAQCVYDCVEVIGVKCNNFKCEAKTKLDSIEENKITGEIAE